VAIALPSQCTDERRNQKRDDEGRRCDASAMAISNRFASRWR